MRAWSDLSIALHRAYINLDIKAQLAEAYAWEEANPTKRKTPRGRSQFIRGWIARAQDKGRAGQIGSPTKTAPNEELDRLRSRAPIDAVRVFAPSYKVTGQSGKLLAVMGEFGGFARRRADGRGELLDFDQSDGSNAHVIWTEQDGQRPQLFGFS